MANNGWEPLLFWTDWSVARQIGLLGAVCLAAGVLWALRHRWAVRIVAALTFLPVPIVAFFSTQYNLVGWHGFMHAAPIYQLMEGGPVPPEEPLFAGGSLRYPWVEHWLVARFSGLTGANAHSVTLVAEVLAYGVLLGAGWWLASAVTRDTKAIALAVLFTGFGVSVAHAGPLTEAIQYALGGLWLENRIVPVNKFANISAMPIGYAAMATAIAAGMRLAVADEGRPQLAATIAGCILVAALVHPLSWMCILPFQAIVGVVVLLGNRPGDRDRAVWLSGAVILPCVLALPYLLSVSVSESSDGWVGLTADGLLFRDKLVGVLLLLAPMALALYVVRSDIGRELREGNRSLAIALLTVVGFAAAYLALRFPGQNEYKFLLALVLPGAVLLGLGLQQIAERHPAIAAPLLVALLAPGVLELSQRPWFRVTEPSRAEGRYLRAIDPDADELYQWIAHETPRDAVFVSRDLSIPPLGRRGMYVVIRGPWKGRDGWGLKRNSLLQWHVRRPDTVMERRHSLAERVLNPEPRRPLEALERIQGDVPGRAVFVHSEDPGEVAILDSIPRLRREFSNRRGTIYRLDSF